MATLRFILSIFSTLSQEKQTLRRIPVYIKNDNTPSRR